MIYGNSLLQDQIAFVTVMLYLKSKGYLQKYYDNSISKKASWVIVLCYAHYFSVPKFLDVYNWQIPVPFYLKLLQHLVLLLSSIVPKNKNNFPELIPVWVFKTTRTWITLDEILSLKYLKFHYHAANKQTCFVSLTQIHLYDSGITHRDDESWFTS